METLAAIGLAANIVQFIFFSSTLISNSHEIYPSASGQSVKIADLAIIADDVEGFCRHLAVSSQTSDPLCDIAESCNMVAREFLNAVLEIQNKGGKTSPSNNPIKWRSFRAALATEWKKSKIEDLTTRLEHLNDRIIMHMDSNISDSRPTLLNRLAKWEQQNKNTGYVITHEIQSLSSRLFDVQKHIALAGSNASRKRLHDSFLKLASSVEHVTQTQSIISSLRYECMNLRQETIKEAHKNTFEWVYRTQNLQPSDPRSLIGFTPWLRRDDGVYWVTGKPGSGKSTLMKFLYGHDEHISNLRVWAGTLPFVRAQFYFWNPGQKMQKTQEGLLQTLLYHILHACPELTPKLCPERWNTASQQRLVPLHASWTLTELHHALFAFIAQQSVASKFYFHIDGLDEYHGDCQELIDILQDLSKAPGIKLCVSSRPWNQFQEAFGRSNPRVLRLQELTKEDIELFAREQLHYSKNRPNFDPAPFDDLVLDIVERAQGVFLWVCLAVRSLRNGIVNHDPISFLKKRLQTIPSELEKFFELILSSVDIVYRTSMANTFLVTLLTESPLRLIHYYFLENDIPYAGPPMLWSDSEIEKKIQRTVRRLNGRYMGLLEPSTTSDFTAKTTVGFLHRTLRDFLSKGPMRLTMEAWAVEDLKMSTLASRAVLAESKYVLKRPSHTQLQLATELAEQAVEEGESKAHIFPLLDEVEAEYARRYHHQPYCEINGVMLRAAVSIGHVEYTLYRLDKDSPSSSLDHILKHAFTCSLPPSLSFTSCLRLDLTCRNEPEKQYRCFSQHRNHEQDAFVNVSPAMIQLLLAHGAHPQVIIKGDSGLGILCDQLLGSNDDLSQNHALEILEIFLRMRCMDTAMQRDLMQHMLASQLLINKSQFTLRCFKILLAANPDPGPKITAVLLRSVVDLHPSTLEATSNDVLDLLRLFFRHGADITCVYEDETGLCWLETVCEQLRTGSLSIFRVAELEVFFQHGLDPNALMWDRTGTIWNCLLEAISTGLHTYTPKTLQHAVRQFVILGLRYGADPRDEKLEQVLEWFKGPECALTDRESLIILRVSEEEITRSRLKQHTEDDQAWSRQNDRRNVSTMLGDGDSRNAQVLLPRQSLSNRHERQGQKSRFPPWRQFKRPICPPGMRRIKWQCKCGASGFGDLRELQAAGIDRLAAQMERCTGAVVYSDSNSSGGTNPTFSFSSIWQSLRNLGSGMWRSSRSNPILPTRQGNAPSTVVGIQTGGSTPNHNPLILMSCIQTGETRRSLFQDDIFAFKNDRRLLEFLRRLYRERRGKFRSALSLRKVVSIHFTQFLVSISKNVEIRHHAMCCTERLCGCLPPSDLVDPGGSDPQYLYTPVPPATSPPYVPDYLLHLFESPSCIDECEKEIFERLPKRTKGELLGKPDQRAKGWGIFYEEGWDLLKIGWLVFLVIFLGSFLFGVLWAVLKKDTQGAFGIAAWWVTIGGSTLALFAINSSRI